MYQFNEGIIHVPQGWHDRTVNLISSNLSGVGPTMSITRDEMPWGMGFQEYIDTQCNRLSKALQDFELLGRRELTINHLPAVELECCWVSRQGKMHQLITSIQDNLMIMAVTTSVPDLMSDEQKTEFRHMASTVKLGLKRG